MAYFDLSDKGLQSGVLCLLSIKYEGRPIFIFLEVDTRPFKEINEYLFQQQQKEINK